VRQSRIGLSVAVLTTGLIVQAAFGAAKAGPFDFTAGDIVVSVEGNGVEGATSGPYGDNQASPLTLFEYGVSGTSSASYAGSLQLPQSAPNTPGSNYDVSGEYGSSSEGTLELSGNGQYLTIAGYGVNAQTFDANQSGFGGATKTCVPSNIICFPLAQTASVANYPTSSAAQQAGDTNQYATVVPRVIAEIGTTGVVNSTTALTGVFNENNPRSVYSANGSSFYISGEGAATPADNTGGVFYTTLDSTSATSITGNDAGSGTSQDTREVQIYNGALYVSSDSKSGSTNRDYIGTLGTAGTPPTTVANSGNGPTQLPGFGNSNGKGAQAITAATTNGINSAGQTISLDPNNFYFANSTTLYVADGGQPKNSSGSTSGLGDGGLQKWTFNGTIWVLDYTISAGLGLVANTNSDGVTGLYGLTGEVITNNGVQDVELFATSDVIGDLDQTYLYGITDVLGNTANPDPSATPDAEEFSVLAAAPADSDFKGVAFAPAPEPASLALLASGVFGVGVLRRRKKALGHRRG
jgi:hypothetical protein